MDEYSGYWKDYWFNASKLDSDLPQKQVARTKFGQPISDDDWLRTCKHIHEQIDLVSSDTVLDLCSGNGLLSAYFVNYVEKIYAVDFSKKLIDSFVVDDSKITKIVSDAMEFKYSNYRFNKAVMYYAAQHFSESTLLKIVKNVHGSLVEGGLFLIGDIPDINRKWDFFNRPEYRMQYYISLENSQPLIGTWYEKGFFKYASEFVGFKSVDIQDQPKYMNNCNHRFDVVFTK